MPSTVEELTKNHVKLTIEVPSSDLKPHLDKAYKAISAQISVPGFRKGHVPKVIIDQRIGKQAILQDAVNEILPEAYGKALDEQGIVPMSEPQIEVVQLEADKDVIFTAEFDKRPDFDLPNWEDLKVEVEPVKMPEASEVDERIEVLRKRFASRKDVERAAAQGDAVIVDLKGSKDGEPLPEATAEGVAYTIGDDSMLDGLDDAVIGLQVGEAKTFHTTLVGGPLKGTEADVEVTLTKVQEVTLPEVDDEFAALVSEFDTVEEMRADLEKGINHMAVYDHAALARDKVLESAVAAASIELADGLLEREIAARKQNVLAQLSQMGVKLADYLEQMQVEQTEEEFYAELEKNTEMAIKGQLVLDKIVETSKFEMDQQDFTQHIMRRAQMNGTSPQAELQHAMEHDHMQEMFAEIRRNKALEYLTEQVKVVDTEGNAVDLSVLKPEMPESDEEENESKQDAETSQTPEVVTPAE